METTGWTRRRSVLHDHDAFATTIECEDARARSIVTVVAIRRRRDRSIDRSIRRRPSRNHAQQIIPTTDGPIDRGRSFVRSFVRSRYAPPPPVSAPLLSPARPRSLASDTRDDDDARRAVERQRSRPTRRPSLVGKMDTGATSRLSVSQWWVFNHSLVV